MYIIEYMGAKSGSIAPFLRDGVGHSKPKRYFRDGTGDVQVFRFRPVGARGDDWKVTPFAQAESVYGKAAESLLKEAVDQCNKLHADYAKLWAQAQRISTARSAMSTHQVMKSLIENPKAFDSVPVGSTELEKGAAALKALQNQTGNEDPDAE